MPPSEFARRLRRFDLPDAVAIVAMLYAADLVSRPEGRALLGLDPPAAPVPAVPMTGPFGPSGSITLPALTTGSIWQNFN